MTGLYIALGIIGAVIVICVIWAVGFYNGIKRCENNVENSFAQVDVQLKRRSDLIPNLIETVKGATKYEGELLKELVKARMGEQQSATQEERIKASDALSGALKGFRLIVEQYPQLQANTGFISLMAELSETENKIGNFRQFYNDSILVYNRKIASFPNNIFARIFGYKKKEYLQTAEAERGNVKVSF